MGYFLTSEAENAVPENSLATPKTHTPLSRVEKRGLRFYSREVGRWANRDPIRERGGRHLYGFVHNAPLDATDGIGLATTAPTFWSVTDKTEVLPAMYSPVDVDVSLPLTNGNVLWVVVGQVHVTLGIDASETDGFINHGTGSIPPYQTVSHQDATTLGHYIKLEFKVTYPSKFKEYCCGYEQVGWKQTIDGKSDNNPDTGWYNYPDTGPVLIDAPAGNRFAISGEPKDHRFVSSLYCKRLLQEGKHLITIYWNVSWKRGDQDPLNLHPGARSHTGELEWSH